VRKFLGDFDECEKVSGDFHSYLFKDGLINS